MLYTDRDFVSVDDLFSIDSDIAEVSSVEGIVLEGPQGLIHQAIEETANKLVSEFQNLGYNWSQQSLRLNTFYGDSTPPARIRVGQVVVDDDTTTYWSPLKRYVVYLALRNVYQSASSRKIDDKYDVKLKQVEKDLSNKYWAAFKKSGLPVCYAPIPCPGAQYELSQGTWTAAKRHRSGWWIGCRCDMGCCNLVDHAGCHRVGS